MKSVYLKSEGTVSGLKGFIALSTNYNFTEEVSSRGRVCMLRGDVGVAGLSTVIEMFRFVPDGVLNKII